MVKISKVLQNSKACKNNILDGDIILSVNSHEINDVIDYRFYLCESKISLLIKRDENIFEVTFKKSMYADIGLEFDTYMMDEKKNCKNKCIFCFVDQLPKNCMRETLYFKDDDERLSFLHGNYITLTNLDDSHIERIIQMRISPINISVHTTNPDLRVKMMKNKRAGETLEYIKQLADADISINAQIVLCKNINDGEELERSLTDLCTLYPSMQSIAVVPSGLTKYREENGLYKLTPFEKSDCEKVIETVNKFGEENLKKFNSRLVYCADEFYLKAKKEIPDCEYYEDYPQYENGVGMIRSFCDDFYASVNLETLPKKFEQPRKVSAVTGEAAYAVIKTLAEDIVKKCGYSSGLSCTVYKIENNFFGKDITVAGLVTGGDIIEQLMPYKNNLGDELLIPAVMLRHERDLFLDNINIKDIETALDIKVRIVEHDNAGDFINAVTGIV